MADKKTDALPGDQAPLAATPPAYEVVGIANGEVFVPALHKTYDLRKLTARDIKELQSINYEHIKVSE